MTDHLIGFEWLVWFEWYEKFEVHLLFISKNLAVNSIWFEAFAWHMISISNS